MISHTPRRDLALFKILGRRGGRHSLCALLMGLSSSSLSGPEHHSSPLYGCFLSSTHRRLLRGATSPAKDTRVRRAEESCQGAERAGVLPDCSEGGWGSTVCKARLFSLELTKAQAQQPCPAGIWAGTETSSPEWWSMGSLGMVSQDPRWQWDPRRAQPCCQTWLPVL